WTDERRAGRLGRAPGGLVQGARLEAGAVPARNVAPLPGGRIGPAAYAYRQRQDIGRFWRPPAAGLARWGSAVRQAGRSPDTVGDAAACAGGGHGARAGGSRRATGPGLDGGLAHRRCLGARQTAGTP